MTKILLREYDKPLSEEKQILLKSKKYVNVNGRPHKIKIVETRKTVKIYGVSF